MKIMLIFAHPDDETFSSGGTVAKLVKEGHTVDLITATKGEAGEVGEPPVTTKEELPQVRARELRRAANILGINSIHFLGFIDGTLENTSADNIKEKISPILKSDRPDIVITYESQGVSNHPDHKTISKIATEVFKEYQKTAGKHVSLYHSTIPQSVVDQYQKLGMDNKAFGGMKGTPDEEVTTVVNIEETMEIKIQALKEHKTQHKDWERFLKRLDKIDLRKEFFKLISENKIHGL